MDSKMLKYDCWESNSVARALNSEAREIKRHLHLLAFCKATSSKNYLSRATEFRVAK